MDHLTRSLNNLFTSIEIDRNPFLRLDLMKFSETISDDNSVFICVYSQKIAVDKTTKQPILLNSTEVKQRFGLDNPFIYLGQYKKFNYIALLLGESHLRADLVLSDLRTLAQTVSNGLAAVLNLAVAMACWHKEHIYCSFCGNITKINQGGHSRVCSQTNCQKQHYPRVNPAIIVLVEKDSKALFGRKTQWPRDRYSTIAGFIEPGECAEQAVVREVAEETGVEVISATYFSSQPWPFPDSLMLGYHALAGNSAITLLDKELDSAIWLDVGEITHRIMQGTLTTPPQISISFRLIEHWFNQNSSIPLTKLQENYGNS